jgi:hypothetical protein
VIELGAAEQLREHSIASATLNASKYRLGHTECNKKSLTVCGACGAQNATLAPRITESAVAAVLTELPGTGPTNGNTIGPVFEFWK